jgi:hypothetical protein
VKTKLHKGCLKQIAAGGGIKTILGWAKEKLSLTGNKEQI